MTFSPFSSVSPVWQPSDNALLAATWDPAMTGSQTTAPAAGTMGTMLIKMATRQAVTNILMSCATAGAALTAGQCFAALYAGIGGPLIGVTADQSAAWLSTGLKTMALAGGPFVAGPGLLVIGWWWNGTTGPKWKGGDPIATANAGLAAAASRFGTANTGLTTSAPGTLGTIAAANTNVAWAALS